MCVLEAGKIVALEGEAPKRVTIVVYDSLEKAQASRNSAAWAALSAERSGKAIKTRPYATEALPKLSSGETGPSTSAAQFGGLFSLNGLTRISARPADWLSNPASRLFAWLPEPDR